MWQEVKKPKQFLPILLRPTELKTRTIDPSAPTRSVKHLQIEKSHQNQPNTLSVENLDETCCRNSDRDRNKISSQINVKTYTETKRTASLPLSSDQLLSTARETQISSVLNTKSNFGA